MDVQLLLVPYDSGRLRWRCGKGPEHLLNVGLTDHLRRLGHVVRDVQVLEDEPGHEPAEIRTAFELARRLAVQVRAAQAAGHFPLVLSGNCNSAIGTLSGLTPARRATFWFDAHGDYNTPETTTTGFLDGMGLAVTTGLCWQRLAATVPGFQPVEPQATFLLGARDLDPPEAALLRESAITVVAATNLPSPVPRAWGKPRWPMPWDTSTSTWLPTVGRANYLPVPNGLSVSQLTATVAAIRAHVPLHAAALASYSPEEDHDQGVARAAFTAIDAILADGN